MNSYTNVFGGHNVNPADLSYKHYVLTGSVTLVWPFEALDGALIVADKIDVQASTESSITLPDASLASVGEDMLFNNIAGVDITVRRSDGTVIIVMPPGTQWYVYLIDNTSFAGQWHVVQMGAGTSAANAAALVGYGLRATETAQIDQNLLTNGVSGDITLSVSGRAQVFRNTGGASIHTIAAANTLGPTPNSNNGWFVIEINAGSGNVVLTPQAGELIDGAASKALGPGESCVVYCYGAGFATMGYGRSLSTTVSGTSIDLSIGTGDYTLSATQIASQVQDFTGTLTGNRTVAYGGVTGYWFVYNNVTNTPGNTYGITFKGGPGDDAVTVAPGSFSILRSQGGALDIAFTATSGTVSLIQGVDGQIETSPTTGITGSGTVGLSAMTTLTPGTYGGVPITDPPTIPPVTKVPIITFDDRGRAKTAMSSDITITTNQVLDLGDVFSFLIPAGVIIPYAGKTLPALVPGQAKYAWLLCDGTTVLKADYPRLWDALGDTYGTPTTTHFTLPDTRGRVMAGMDPTATILSSVGLGGTTGSGNRLGFKGGAQTHTLTAAEVAVHRHSEPVGTAGFLVPNAGELFGTPGVASSGIGYTNQTGDNAPTGGSAHKNVQPTMMIRHIIKT